MLLKIVILLITSLALFSKALALEPPSAQAPVANAADSQWIRPQKPGDPLIWGRRDGIVFGLPSAGGLLGPRGLIRVGVISPKTGKPELLNYIAIEPVILGPGTRFSRMAFSELEPSRMDPGSRGKRLWVDPGTSAPSDSYRGELHTFPNHDGPIQRLSIQIDVERFTANNAHVYLIASIDSDHPDELRLAVHQYDDSPALEELTVTATMGNYERLRQLWLKGRIVNSHDLYGTYTADAFVEHENYPLDEMLQNADGDAIALCTSDETAPSEVPVIGAEHWRYRLPKLTQYWRVPAHDIQPDLRVRVNGRRVYWASHNPLPGGAAFENFEVRQRYLPGQVFIFGVTSKAPWQFDPPIPYLSPSHP
ncbi:hypothetical protein [Edaphobacter dinghuensis]|uniref:Uncharacterized protein n=1 Tax=Edaphobacter dinghuensis TaxID=1560005 RepID=A0A917M1D5_9BACT|nr:hypothetical protein [Edaphobacter dinghuensis]GGG70326.1 hypothetical protein GCM10011585_10580 [Edaphobacter dinghuensis]